jgi:hypothetical protein
LAAQGFFFIAHGFFAAQGFAAQTCCCAKTIGAARLSATLVEVIAMLPTSDAAIATDTGVILNFFIIPLLCHTPKLGHVEWPLQTLCLQIQHFVIAAFRKQCISNTLADSK